MVASHAVLSDEIVNQWNKSRLVRYLKVHHLVDIKP
jgi:hypothetical protein